MADNIDYGSIVKQGLWGNNVGLVQLLGLCPLLAVTGSVINALGLGLATMLVLVCSNTAVSLVRSSMSDTVRLPASVMIIAAFTTCIELLMKAFTFELYQILGIFIPLIVTNCSILGRADAFASKNRVLPSVVDGLMMGVGFALVLVAIGAIRELLGSGTLFADMHLLFGEPARDWRVTVFDNYSGFLVAVLPPGAFVVTGFLIALKSVIDSAFEKRQRAIAVESVAVRERARVTGKVE